MPRQEDGDDSETLRAVEVPTISNEECNQEIANYATERQFCGGYKEGGKDHCEVLYTIIIVRQTDNHWEREVLEWRTQTGRRNVSRSPTRWTDHIVQDAGNAGWMQVACLQSEWRSKGQYDMNDDDGFVKLVLERSEMICTYPRGLVLKFPILYFYYFSCYVLG